MEIPAPPSLADRPAILLNAHIDTIQRSTPERIAFDRDAGDFYHLDETNSAKVSSFGGDDRSAAAAIVEAVRHLHAKYWSHGVAHRRIVLVFTALEETGCLGAKYLAAHQPELFEMVEISLSMDGPLDLRSSYPQDSFVAVSAESDRSKEPYKRVLGLVRAFCDRSGTRFAQTEFGLGMGDFASFPPSAHAGLHLRSPVRGWHNKERVKLQDQINHVDLLCYILLGMDDKVPKPDNSRP
jgi:putative aminopeptidase FrvX